jgi:hypothetical protein
VGGGRPSPAASRVSAARPCGISEDGRLTERARGSHTMSDLKKKFSRKEWKDCCGKGCKKCEIAQTYIGVYGKSKGLDKLRDDRKAMHAKKSDKKKSGKK